MDNVGDYRQPDFKFSVKTEAYYSCGVTFENHFFIYGGYKLKTQISRVEGCALKRVGSLPFDHDTGACAIGNGEVYLCFSWDYRDVKKCRKSSNPERNFKEITQSNHEHRWTRIASSEGFFLLEFVNFELVQSPFLSDWTLKTTNLTGLRIQML